MLLTVVLNVTAVPELEGFNDDLNDVEVAAGLTVWASTGDVLVPKLMSPPYCAENE